MGGSKMKALIETDGIENEIKVKGLNILKEFFDMQPEQLDNQKFIQFLQKAKLGMAFYKEFNVNTRIGIGQKLRIIAMISEDKKESKRYIKSSMPKYYPI